jgi:hypothetical protein
MIIQTVFYCTVTKLRAVLNPRSTNLLTTYFTQIRKLLLQSTWVWTSRKIIVVYCEIK